MQIKCKNSKLKKKKKKKKHGLILFNPYIVP